MLVHEDFFANSQINMGRSSEGHTGSFALAAKEGSSFLPWCNVSNSWRLWPSVKRTPHEPLSRAWQVPQRKAWRQSAPPLGKCWNHYLGRCRTCWLSILWWSQEQWQGLDWHLKHCKDIGLSGGKFMLQRECFSLKTEYFVPSRILFWFHPNVSLPTLGSKPRQISI